MSVAGTHSMAHCKVPRFWAVEPWLAGAVGPQAGRGDWARAGRALRT